MGLGDFLLGSKEERASMAEGKELGKLRTKRKLSYEEGQKREAAFSAWVKVRMRQALMAGGLAAILGVTGGRLMPEESEPAPLQVRRAASAQADPETSMTQREKEFQSLLEREKDRLESKEKWLANLQMVVDKTDDAQAQEVLSFLRANAAVFAPVDVVPERTGGILLEEMTGDYQLGMVPLVQRDKHLRGVWAQLADSNLPKTGEAGAVAHFLHQDKLLVLKGHIPFSDLFAGIVLAHEGEHARRYLTEPYPLYTAEQFSDAERRVHDFQNRLMLSVGGEAYETALVEAAEMIKKAMVKTGSKPGGTIVQIGGYDERLDEAFGPALSSFERATRISHFLIHANFVVVDEAFADDPALATQMRNRVYQMFVFGGEGREEHRLEDL